MSKTIDIECAVCKKNFPRRLASFNRAIKNQKNGNTYSPLCSQECKKKLKYFRHQLKCDNCGIEILKNNSNFLKSKQHFCSHSCAATITNKNRKLSLNKTKIINCKICGLSAEICNNATNICNLCRKNIKIAKINCKKENAVKNIENRLCVVCYKNMTVLQKSYQKYCDDCRHERFSIHAINRVQTDNNDLKLKSIVCCYYYNNIPIKCASKAEYSCLNYMENNFEIKEMKRSNLILKYELDGKIRRYNPDFECLLKDGTIFIIECKTNLSCKDLQRKWNIYYKSIIPKKIALENFCKEMGYETLFYNKNMNSKFYNSLSREQLQNATGV